MRSVGALLLVLLGAVASAPAFAQGGNRERAVVLATEANELFEEGEFERAAVLLEQAYALFPTPSLLYNIARAYEEAGDPVRAIDAYQRYLATAEVSDLERRDLDEIIERLERSADPTLPDPNPDPDSDPDVRPELPDGSQTEEPGAEPPVGAIVTASAGAALLLAGIPFGVGSAGAYDQAAQSFDWRERMQLFQEGTDLAIAANVFFVVGGLVTLAGGIWLIVALTESDDGGGTSVTFGPSSVGLRHRF